MKARSNEKTRFPAFEGVSEARRTGGIVFVIGAAVQALVLFLVLVGVTLMDYLNRGWDFVPGQTVEGFVDFVMDDRFIYLSALFSLLVLVAMNWPLGRWAGKAIGIRKRKFGWVAMGVAVLSAFLTGLCFVVCVVAAEDVVREKVAGDFARGFIFPTLEFSCFILVPGILTGLLSGLVVRQRLRVVEERLRMEKAAENHLD